MASLGDKITVVIDVVTNKATSGLKDFRSAVSEAQGVTGKLKAGVSSLGETFGLANAGPAAAATALSAAGKAAWDAAQQYAELGIRVSEFSTATGTSVADASRLLEVSGDLGVDSGALQVALGKLNKTIDPSLFSKLGIAIKQTSDGATDVSGTFLNVIQKLQDIRDPAEQARVASQLLGRGWQSLAPIIGSSAGDIAKRLEDVADVKVFDDEKVKRSKAFRDALNNVTDTFEELKLQMGEGVLPAFSGLMEVVSDTLGIVNDFDKSMQNLLGTTEFLFISPLGGFFDMIGLGADDASESTEQLAAKQREALAATSSMGDGAAQSARYLGLLSEHTRESADAAIDLTSNARLARAQLKLLQDQIEGRKSFIDLQIQLRENAKRIKEVADDFDQGLISAEEYYTGVASASLDSQAALADYLAVTDEIPETVKTEILAEFDPLNPQKAWQDIQSYFDSHTIQVTTETDRENRRPNGGTPTTSSGSTGNLSGNRTPGVTESVGGWGRNAASVTVNVNAPVGANLVEAGRQVADALRAYYNNGGEPV